MDSNELKLKDFEASLMTYHILSYEELPDFDLYMDQVVLYLNRHLSFFSKGTSENLITSSMINNYVKHEIIPSPNKKKYNSRHLSYIISVFFLKQVFSMNEIKHMIKQQLEHNNELTAYQNFCYELESAFKRCCRHQDETKASNDSLISDYCLKYAAMAIAYKIYAQGLIDIQTEVLEEDVKNSTKDDAKREKDGKK